jgi:hypothetical protein
VKPLLLLLALAILNTLVSAWVRSKETHILDLIIPARTAYEMWDEIDREDPKFKTMVVSQHSAFVHMASATALAHKVLIEINLVVAAGTVVWIVIRLLKKPDSKPAGALPKA